MENYFVWRGKLFCMAWKIILYGRENNFSCNGNLYYYMPYLFLKIITN